MGVQIGRTQKVEREGAVNERKERRRCERVERDCRGGVQMEQGNKEHCLPMHVVDSIRTYILWCDCNHNSLFIGSITCCGVLVVNLSL